MKTMLTVNEIVAYVKDRRLDANQSIPVKKLFISKYGIIPRKINITPALYEDGRVALFHVKSLLHRLYGNADDAKQFSITQCRFHACSKTYYACEQLLSLPKIDGLLISLSGCSWVVNYTNNSKQPILPDYMSDQHFLTVDRITMFYLPEHDSFVQKLAYDLSQDDTLCLQEPQIAILRLIGKKNHGQIGSERFYLTGSVCIKKPRINDLSLSYGGKNFLNVHSKIVTWLNKEDANGVVLLHGTPGSGKYNSINLIIKNIIHMYRKNILHTLLTKLYQRKERAMFYLCSK